MIFFVVAVCPLCFRLKCQKLKCYVMLLGCFKESTKAVQSR